jgi:hypothetical protein
MNLQELTTLSQLDIAETAWKEGVLLGKRTEDFHTIYLYVLDELYIESTYHTHFNVLLHISFFTDPARLDPYLEAIDLSSLLA